MAAVQIIPKVELAAAEAEAMARIGQRDPDDWPAIGGALRFDCPLWTEDEDFFGSGVAELLSKHAPRTVGLSEGTTCFVSADCFREESRFEDFAVREAAHVFHNCKHRTIGLHDIRGREWLLEIDFVKRGTFAYACDAYSRILAVGGGPSVRKHLLSEREKELKLSEDRVDVAFLKSTRGVEFHSVWPLVSEASFFLDNPGKIALLEWLEQGPITFHEIGMADLAVIRATMKKYRDLSPDFTDAVLVALAGIHGIDKIVTVDVRDFSAYRLPDGKVIGRLWL